MLLAGTPVCVSPPDGYCAGACRTLGTCRQRAAERSWRMLQRRWIRCVSLAILPNKRTGATLPQLLCAQQGIAAALSAGPQHSMSAGLLARICYLWMQRSLLCSSELSPPFLQPYGPGPLPWSATGTCSPPPPPPHLLDLSLALPGADLRSPGSPEPSPHPPGTCSVLPQLALSLHCCGCGHHLSANTPACWFLKQLPCATLQARVGKSGKEVWRTIVEVIHPSLAHARA